VAIEFAFIAPVLLLMVLGAGVFGIAIDNYIQLTGAASIGARQLAISRGAATPYTDTVAQLKGAAPNLIPASLTITLKVNGTACATDAACNTALVSGVPAQVIACTPAALWFMGKTLRPAAAR
jgi:Flp pilus assembly protein TadG